MDDDFIEAIFEFLVENEGENLRKLYKAKLTKKGKKDLEKIIQHPRLKPFVPH